jgi:hypothetical protein
MDDDVLKGIRRIRPQAEIGLEDELGVGVGGALPSLFAGKVHLPEMRKTMAGGTVPLAHSSSRPGLTVLNPSTRGPLGPGVYASDNSNVYSRYGDNTYRFEVPRGDIFHGTGSRDIGDYFPNHNPTDLWRSQAERVAQVSGDKAAQVRDVFNKRWSEEGYQLFGDLSRIFGGDTIAQDVFRRAGFKGISGHVDGPEYLMFDPVQVQ